MTARELAAQVLKMRKAQSDYFHARKVGQPWNDLLDHARAEERRIDKICKEVLKASETPSMF